MAQRLTLQPITARESPKRGINSHYPHDPGEYPGVRLRENLRAGAAPACGSCPRRSRGVLCCPSQGSTLELGRTQHVLCCMQHGGVLHCQGRVAPWSWGGPRAYPLFTHTAQRSTFLSGQGSTSEWGRTLRVSGHSLSDILDRHYRRRLGSCPCGCVPHFLARRWQNVWGRSHGIQKSRSEPCLMCPVSYKASVGGDSPEGLGMVRDYSSVPQLAIIGYSWSGTLL
jgi:hypothetical protein